MSIRIGILGYGNLGRGVECAIRQNPDMELAAVFTRRKPEDVQILTETAKVCPILEAEEWKDKIDVMILCGGSATDLPKQSPEFAKMFNIVDSFDTHARIPEHFANVDAAAKEGGKIGIISALRFAIAAPINAQLFDSVPPEVKKISFSFTFIVRAIFSLASRRYFSASMPFKCLEDGLP